jgi:uncharacterized phage protein gp47/JayE
MFEENTFESLMDDMLSQVSDDTDTREGSVIHDAIAPMALENEQVYSDLGLVLDECFADTASYYYLVKRAAERGVFVREGTAAVLKIECTPADATVEVGNEFTIGDLIYTVSENLTNGFYAITCNEIGEAGNDLTNDVIPVNDIEGLESVVATEIITAGTDDEDEENLRKRYFDSFVNVAFGGNKAEYKNKADEFENVYGCKVYPVWNGGGTVKLKILGADYKAASSSVVEEIQQAFDPTQDGGGVGIAPIDHIVTVDTVAEIPINVSLTIAYVQGYSWADISERFATAFEEYLLELRKAWENSESLIVRVGRIESILLDFEAVDNVSAVSINSGASGANYTVAGDKVPVGGVYNG